MIVIWNVFQVMVLHRHQEVYQCPVRYLEMLAKFSLLKMLKFSFIILASTPVFISMRKHQEYHRYNYLKYLVCDAGQRSTLIDKFSYTKHINTPRIHISDHLEWMNLILHESYPYKYINIYYIYIYIYIYIYYYLFQFDFVACHHPIFRDFCSKE